MIPVASYCRVSTDRGDQANSFESQQRYFREYIDRHPDWELYEVYADEGITGTSTKKRTQFNRMISDACQGKFRLILTKEVSRFSRNLLDTIAYTRELKSLGVGVVFMNDGFSSLDPDAELRLSIMGSIAQEESRKTSTRVKWGQTRQMERGVVFGTSMLGYDVRGGKMTVEPEGAELVRLIFRKYGVEKKGTTVIARELREAGYKTYKNQTLWSSSHIVKLLRNEKYVGDLVQKKTITPDYLSHAKKYNKGEESFIVLRDHHEPIIDRALWNTVQEELDRRKPASSGRSSRHVFSGKLLCAECGARFTARTKKRKSGTSYLRWSCPTASNQGIRTVDSQGNAVGCDIAKTIRDELLMDALIQALQSIPVDLSWVIKNLNEILTSVCRDGPAQDLRKLTEQIEQTAGKKEAAIDAYLSGAITREELSRMKEIYDEKLTALQKCLDSAGAAEPSPGPEDKIRAIVTGSQPEKAFLRNILDHAIIEKDGTLHLRLQHLPQTWYFAIRYHKTDRGYHRGFFVDSQGVV